MTQLNDAMLAMWRKDFVGKRGFYVNEQVSMDEIKTGVQSTLDSLVYLTI